MVDRGQPRRLAAALAAAGFASLSGTAWAQAKAQEGWSLSGSMRLRYEALEGQARPGFNPSDDMVSLRTILTAEYRRGPLRLGAEVYDSRAWGADRRTPISTNEVNTFEPVQAYVGLSGKSQALGPVAIQAGRFTLNLGSRRLVAADDYRNTTNGYTGVRLDLAPAGIKTNLIYVLPQQRRPDGPQDVLDNRHAFDRENGDLVLWGGVAAKPKAIGKATLEASYFHLTERDAPGRPTRDRRLDTYGLRVIRDPALGRPDFEVEAFAQTGSISASAAAGASALRVRAGFLHADAGYTFDHPWKPRLSAEFDLATGDGRGGRFGRFDTLFGMRRAELAPSALYAVIGRTNLVTPGLRMEIAPSPRWDAFMVARAMWLEARADAFSTSGVQDATGRTGRFAGNQVEGRLRYWLVPDRLRFEANGVWLDKGRFLKAAPNAPRTGDERYMSLNLTAQF